jgi:hypothetical protein
VEHQAAGLDEGSLVGDRRQAVLQRQLRGPPGDEGGVDDHRAHAPLGQAGQGRIDVLGPAHIDDLKLQPRALGGRPRLGHQ